MGQVGNRNPHPSCRANPHSHPLPCAQGEGLWPVGWGNACELKELDFRRCGSGGRLADRCRRGRRTPAGGAWCGGRGPACHRDSGRGSSPSASPVWPIRTRAGRARPGTGSGRHSTSGTSRSRGCRRGRRRRFETLQRVAADRDDHADRLADGEGDRDARAGHLPVHGESGRGPVGLDDALQGGDAVLRPVGGTAGQELIARAGCGRDTGCAR